MADSANMTNLVLTKGALTAEVIPATAEEELDCPTAAGTARGIQCASSQS